jgi:hypothetical protein
MFPIKTRPNRFFALGSVFVFSLVSMSVILVTIASAQGHTPRVWHLTEVGAEESVLQDGVVRVKPAVTVAENGEEFRVHIMIDDADDLGAFQFVMDYDPAFVKVPNQSSPVALGPFLGSTGRAPTQFINEVNPTTGVITYVIFTTGSNPGPDGDGMLAFVDLEARALGTTVLDLKEVEVTGTSGSLQDVSIGDGLVVIASPPNPAQVSINKSVDPPTVAPQQLLTYTLQRSFAFPGQHSYNEIVFDPIPGDTTYLAGSATLNGLPAPQLYDGTLKAIYYQRNSVFTDTEQWTITFQVQIGSLFNRATVVNSVTETTSFDGAAYSGPYTSTSSAALSCNVVSDVNLALLTSGDIYTNTNVVFSADILPDDANKPYHYTIDYDDGTDPVTDVSSDDPLELNHVFATPGSHTVRVAIWNCAMAETEAVHDEVPVASAPAPPKFPIYLPILMRSHNPGA